VKILIGQVSKAFRKTLKKTRESILHDLFVKQKPQLDGQIEQIKPKRLQQTIKFLKAQGASIGKRFPFKGLGRAIGRFKW
jgi:hypothetical protein